MVGAVLMAWCLGVLGEMAALVDSNGGLMLYHLASDCGEDAEDERTEWDDSLFLSLCLNSQPWSCQHKSFTCQASDYFLELERTLLDPPDRC
jgi:hypothetical protein